jgi:hypothetical protein
MDLLKVMTNEGGHEAGKCSKMISNRGDQGSVYFSI